jgi:predicted RNA-binding protein with PUA-like domain
MRVIYHTGDERCVAGLAEVIRAPYADPQRDQPKLQVVDVVAIRSIENGDTLAQIKADLEFDGSLLVRQGRLSVVPLTSGQFVWLAQSR